MIHFVNIILVYILMIGLFNLDEIVNFLYIKLVEYSNYWTDMSNEIHKELNSTNSLYDVNNIFYQSGGNHLFYVPDCIYFEKLDYVDWAMHSENAAIFISSMLFRFRHDEFVIDIGISFICIFVLAYLECFYQKFDHRGIDVDYNTNPNIVYDFGGGPTIFPSQTASYWEHLDIGIWMNNWNWQVRKLEWWGGYVIINAVFKSDWAYFTSDDFCFHTPWEFFKLHHSRDTIVFKDKRVGLDHRVFLQWRKLKIFFVVIQAWSYTFSKLSKLFFFFFFRFKKMYNSFFFFKKIRNRFVYWKPVFKRISYLGVYYFLKKKK